jgi:hypothetical protein
MPRRNLPLQFDLFGDWLVAASGDPADRSEEARQIEDIVQAPQPSGLSDDARHLLAERLAEKLAADGEITSEFLTSTANAVFGGTQAEGVYSPKDAYDAMEAAFNIHLGEAKETLSSWRLRAHRKQATKPFSSPVAYNCCQPRVAETARWKNFSNLARRRHWHLWPIGWLT